MKSADGRFEYQDKDGEPLPDGSSLTEVGRLEYECRSQKGHCSVNIANAGYQIEKRNWKLTGTVDAPTITPSINCADCWHGFLRDGRYYNTAEQLEPKQ